MDTQNTYQKSLRMKRKREFTKCLLLYSGGLDTSVMLKWIQEQYECEMYTLTVDIGQTVDNLEEIKQRRLSLAPKKRLSMMLKTNLLMFC